MNIEEFKQVFRQYLVVDDRENWEAHIWATLTDRFPGEELSGEEGRNLKRIHAVILEAANRYLDEALPEALAPTRTELEELDDAYDFAGFEDIGWRATLCYDIVEAIQADWMNQTPMGSFREIVLPSAEKTGIWCENFMERALVSERGQLADYARQLAERKFVRPLRDRVLRAEQRRQATEEIGNRFGAERPADAPEVMRRLETLNDSCPQVAAHLNRILTAGGTSIRFSPNATDAYYTPLSMAEHGVPKNTIILPKNGKAPVDLIDAMIFESCNAEIQPAYDALNRRMFDSLDRAPVQSRAYGREKAGIEAGATLKDAQLLCEMRDKDVEVAEQGNRNLLAMLMICRELSGGEPIDFATIAADGQALEETLHANHGELRLFLEEMNTDEEKRRAFFEHMATSPHNRNAENDWDVGRLPSEDRYAYELIQTLTPKQTTSVVMGQIRRLPGSDALPLAQIEDVVARRIGTGGFGPEMRVTLVLQIIEDLKTLYPELAAAEFPTLACNEGMRRMAEAQAAHFAEEPPPALETNLRSDLEGEVGKIFPDLQSNLGFVATLQEDLRADVAKALAGVAPWRGVAAADRVVEEIRRAAGEDLAPLDGPTAERLATELTEAIGGQFGAIEKAVTAFDCKAQTPEVLGTRVDALQEASAAFPPAIQAVLRIRVHGIRAMIADLQRYFGTVG